MEEVSEGVLLMFDTLSNLLNNSRYSCFSGLITRASVLALHEQSKEIEPFAFSVAATPRSRPEPGLFTQIHPNRPR